MYFLTEQLYFPPANETTPDGLLAIGGDLSPERIMLAYYNGIFPWFEDGEPILWWSPPKRMVVHPSTYKAPKSLRNFIKKKLYTVTFNQAFEEVITNCQKKVRTGQMGTWITDEMKDAYINLHRMGKAMSVEVWKEDELIGGLYGIDLGHVFCGESMFSHASNASKVGFVHLVNHLKQNNYLLLDCQLYNDHLALLGAFEISRKSYLSILTEIK